jgi:D-alanine--poly(phosphoribitol) ligase subunit 1
MLATAFNTLIDRLRTDFDSVALMTGEGRMTWGQLGRRVAGLSLALGSLREPGPVLVRGHKQADVVAAMIASVCAGRGFVFAEANFPVARVSQIVATCGCAGVIDASGAAIAAALPVIDATQVGDAPCRLNPMDPVDEAALFYVTFTSGSTGQPKGIPVSRANFAAFLAWMEPHVAGSMIGADAAVNHASMAFDMSMSDIWLALMAGRASYLLDHAHNVNPIANITFLSRDPDVAPGTLMSTPAFLGILLESPRFTAARLPRLRAFWVGGEEVPKPLLLRLRRAFPDSAIYHAYGPSEVTCVTHCHPLSDADLSGDDPLSLGCARGRTRVLVDCGDGVLRTVGEGEIVLAGAQVAGRYLPADHPNNVNFGTHEGEPSYRTGDKGFLSPGGAMRILGRIDRQVKINGLRIELGAIEHCALEVRGIEVAVAVLRMQETRSLMLILGGRAMPRDGVERVRAHLAAELPPYMQPSRIEVCTEVPLTLSGKIDRRGVQSLYA